MRRVAPALALALLAAACSTSPCQQLGEKLCACTGTSKDACTTQVQQQLNGLNLTEGRCDDILAKCKEPAGTSFCEWLLTCPGQLACEIAPAGSCQPPPP